MPTTWFTADTHFFHRAILKYCGRVLFMNPEETKLMEEAGRSAKYPNQYDKDAVAHINISDESLDRMNEALVTNWNSRVTKQDTVWHLGDFGFFSSGHYGKSTDKLMTLRRRLNGKINFIHGNHDDWAVSHNKCFHTYQDVKMIKIEDTSIWLSHYAHRVWPKSHYGAWHLFGHSHGILPPYSNSYDVGVDRNEYYPISFEEVRERLGQ